MVPRSSRHFENVTDTAYPLIIEFPLGYSGRCRCRCRCLVRGLVDGDVHPPTWIIHRVCRNLSCRLQTFGFRLRCRRRNSATRKQRVAEPRTNAAFEINLRLRLNIDRGRIPQRTPPFRKVETHSPFRFRDSSLGTPTERFLRPGR